MHNKSKISPADERELIKIANQLPALQKTDDTGSVVYESVTIKRKGWELPKGSLCNGKPVKANLRYKTTFKRPIYIDKVEHLKEIFRKDGHEGVQNFIDSIEEAINKQMQANEPASETTEA